VGIALCAATASPAAADSSPVGFDPPDTTIEDQGEQYDAFGSTLATGDFNGDTYEDVAVGVPEEDFGVSVEDAGAVNVIYGSFGGLSATAVPDQFWHQDSPGIEDEVEPGDRFGSALAAGDFNGDGLDDLAIGVPGETQRYTFLRTGAGAVNVIYGSTGGLSATKVSKDFWEQGIDGVHDTAESEDHFGSDLAAGNFNADNYDDLAIGAPDENLPAAADAGAVHVIHGAGGGLSTTAVPTQFLRQGAGGVDGSVRNADRFGFRLAVGRLNGDNYDDLAIGVPGELVGQATNAGAVNVIYGSFGGLSATHVPDQLWHQGMLNAGDGAETDDRFGSRLAIGDFDRTLDKSMAHYDDLAIGVPEEDLSRNRMNAGVVNVIYGASGGLSATEVPSQVWDQDSPDVEGEAQHSDQFGYALAVGSFNSDPFDDLAIGVPTENVILGTDTRAAGAVNVIHGYTRGLDAKSVPDQYWDQNVPDVEDDKEPFDGFGRALAAGRLNGDPYDDLAIGVPGEDLTVDDMGAMNVLHGTGGGLSANVLFDQFWHQDS